MTYHFGFIQPKGELPVEAFIHSAKSKNPHWHLWMEFPAVLEGMKADPTKEFKSTLESLVDVEEDDKMSTLYLYF